MKWLAGFILLVAPALGAACTIAWDAPAPGDIGWLEGIRFYRDGVEVGTASVIPPVDCTSAGVEPCPDCVYTAKFFRGAEESLSSDPLEVAVGGSPTGGVITIGATTP